VTRDQIVAAAIQVGLRDLTLQAVAERLGVSIPALYRYVTDRDHLEALVGDALAAEFQMPAQHSRDVHGYLVEIGHGVRRLTLDHDGLGDYLNRLGAHSPNWLTVIEHCDQALVELGLAPADAVALGSAVANFAIASVERQRHAELNATSGRLQGRYYDAVTAIGPAHLPVLHDGQQTLVGVDPDDYFAWSLDCYVSGLLTGLERAPWRSAVIGRR